MKTLLPILLLLVACTHLHGQQDTLSVKRIEYVHNLKQLVSDSIWPGFSQKEHNTPLVYYTSSSCYVANPTSYFISLYNPLPVAKSGRLQVYKMPLLDSIPFHMHVSITLGDSTADYNYRSPFIRCSSVEITQQVIPSTRSTEEWATMVLHEYFHGFQLSHRAFLDFYEQNVAFTSPQSMLDNLYKKNAWFSESVDKENELMLAAIASQNREEVRRFIDTLFQCRTSRWNRASQELTANIKLVEQAYELMEGSARYVEYGLYSLLAGKQPDANLVKADSAYHSYKFFKNFTLKDHQWLYKTSKTPFYFYATGFNMLRLLDKLGVDYKSRLFSEGGLPIEQVLLENYRK